MELRSASKVIRYNDQTSMIIENKPLPKPDLRTSIDLSENSSESSFSGEETPNSSSSDEEQLDQGDHLFFQRNEEYKVDWKDATRFSTSKVIPKFESDYGVKQNIGNLSEPYQFFGWLLPSHFLQQICKWTIDSVEKQSSRRKRLI